MNLRSTWKKLGDTTRTVVNQVTHYVERQTGVRDGTKSLRLINAIEQAQKDHADQPERLRQMAAFFDELPLAKEHKDVLLDAAVIAAFMTSGTKARFEEAQAQGSWNWWNDHVLQPLKTACGPDAARDFLRICSPALARTLEKAHPDLAKPLLTEDERGQASWEALAADAVRAAEQACKQQLALSNPDHDQLSDEQRVAVLFDGALREDIDCLLKRLDAHPEQLKDVLRALCPVKGVLVPHTLAISMLTVRLMLQAAAAQRPFDLPAFVAMLSEVGFPSAGMGAVAHTFTVMATWTSGFRGHLLDSAEQRLGEPDVPAKEKALWTMLLKEFAYRGHTIEWSGPQRHQLNHLIDRLMATGAAFGKPVANVGASGDPAAPGSERSPIALLLQQGLPALLKPLKGLASQPNKPLFAATYLAAVSDPAVRQVFNQFWQPGGKAPFPMQDVMLALQHVEERDRALALVAILHAGLTVAPQQVDRKAFMLAVLTQGQLSREHLEGFPAVLLHALAQGAQEPGEDVVNVLEFLVDLSGEPGLSTEHLEQVVDLLMQTRNRADRTDRLQGRASKVFQNAIGVVGARVQESKARANQALAARQREQNRINEQV